jgi:hypothetical protein
MNFLENILNTIDFIKPFFISFDVHLLLDISSFKEQPDIFHINQYTWWDVLHLGPLGQL